MYLTALWEQNKALICTTVHRFASQYDITSRGYTTADIEQECYFIFCDMVKAYDSSKPYKFTAYLEYCTKNHLNGIFGNRNKAKSYDLLNTASSLDVPLTDDDGLTLADIIPDETSNEIDEAEHDVFIQQVKESLDGALNTLETAQRDCIVMNYYNGLTVAETGKLLNMTREQARRNISKGFAKLRRNDELKRFKSEIVSAYAYRHIGYTSFMNIGSLPERLVEMLDK